MALCIQIEKTTKTSTSTEIFRISILRVIVVRSRSLLGLRPRVVGDSFT